jgi:hypothetical protein
VLATFLVPLACGNVDDLTVESAAAQALETAGEVFKIGFLVDAASGGKADFVAAANLAETQLNQGLQQAGSAHRFDVMVVEYAAGTHQDVAIDLINNQGVLAIVTDGNQTSADVNNLNYEFIPRVNHPFPVTCFQCSSTRFNSDGDTFPGFGDPDGWLFRTFFDARFESPLHVRMVRARTGGGDLNDDGHIKIAVWFDPAHQFEAFEFPGVFDSLYSGSHSTELWFRSGNPDFDLPNILDSDPDGHFPDVVVVLMQEQEIMQHLTAYKNFAAASKPPVQVNEAARQDHLLPSLIALGLPGLQGTSVLRVSNANTGSGNLFKNAFTAATGHQPAMNASYAYDSLVMHAGAIGWAFHFGSLDPFVIVGNMFNVNDPSGAIIKPRASDYKTAAQRINREKPINYDGASSSMDVDFRGENFPDLATWKISNGQFSDMNVWRCNDELPLCQKR